MRMEQCHPSHQECALQKLLIIIILLLPSVSFNPQLAARALCVTYVTQLTKTCAYIVCISLQTGHVKYVNALHTPRPPHTPRLYDWKCMYTLVAGNKSRYRPHDSRPNGNYQSARSCTCSIHTETHRTAEVLLYVHRNRRFIRDGSHRTQPVQLHSVRL